MKKAFLIALVTALCMAHMIAAELLDPAKGAVLENEFVRLEFEPGGMGLSAMIDRRTGVNHVNAVSGKHALWEIAMARGTQIVRMTNNDKPCTRVLVEPLAGGGERLVMQWNALRWWKENGAITVEATIDLPKHDGVALWRILVENRSDYWGLWTVSYPIVNGFPASGDYDLARPAFSSGGQLIKHWDGKFHEVYPGGAWPMQFFSLSRGASGVYVGALDGEARLKNFVAESGARVAVIHYPDNMAVAGSDYPDYYPVAFGVYRGGWLEAAQRYRPWALAQKWSRAGTISQRSRIPTIFKKAAYWILGGLYDNSIWNGATGTPAEMNAPLIDAQKFLGVPVGLHWYRWNEAMDAVDMDHQYPHFVPTMPGFKERVKDLVDRGVLVMPYMNGLSADMDIPDFAKFAPAANIDQAGGYRMHYYMEGSGRLLTMCPTQEVWKSEINGVVDRLAGEYGVNGAYVDQITAHMHEPCFNRNHGHPLGGGHYWADGFRDMMRTIQNVAHRNGRDVVITSEANLEVFNDVLDGNLVYASPTEREIPMLQIVYSGYTLLIGSPCNYAAMDQRRFSYVQGQALIEGRQPGWMDLGLFKPEHAGKAAFIKLCARYRGAAEKYLTYGRLLQPVEPAQPIPTFRDEFAPARQATVPCVQARLWQAEDGNLALFMANACSEVASFSYTLDPTSFGLKCAVFQLREITPEKSISIGSRSGKLNRKDEIGPEKIKVIEIVCP